LNGERYLDLTKVSLGQEEEKWNEGKWLLGAVSPTALTRKL